MLLILVLVGTVVPIQLPGKNERTIIKATFTIEDQTIGGKLHAKVLKNTKTGEGEGVAHITFDHRY